MSCQVFGVVFCEAGGIQTALTFSCATEPESLQMLDPQEVSVLMSFFVLKAEISKAGKLQK